MRIHCFSGNGNSAAVAARLGQLLHDESNDILWVFPVYAWGIPPVVVSRIKEMDLNGIRCHMVCTCGDETGNIDRQWHRLILSCGGVPGGIYSVQMPNTYVCLPFFNVDKPEIASQKLNASGQRIDTIAEWLSDRDFRTDLLRGSLPWFKTTVIYPWFGRFLMDSSKFLHTNSCTACALCSKMCPCHNISTGPEGYPQWDNHCASCLRCYHICPRHAVAYGKRTAGKGQYLHPLFRKLFPISAK